MADPTPWQVASAGQKIPSVRVARAVFSHGTVPWPYAPHYVIDDNSAAHQPPEYGVNTHQPPTTPAPT